MPAPTAKPSLSLGMAVQVLLTRQRLLAGTRRRVAVIAAADVVQRAHDLRRAPSLVNAEVGDDVRAS